MTLTGGEGYRSARPSLAVPVENNATFGTMSSNDMVLLAYLDDDCTNRDLTSLFLSCFCFVFLVQNQQRALAGSNAAPTNDAASSSSYAVMNVGANIEPENYRQLPVIANRLIIFYLFRFVNFFFLL